MSLSSQLGSGVQLIEISADQAGQRIDNFLIAQLKGAPKSLVYRILRKGEVRVNKGRIKPDYRLHAGDQVRLPPVRLAPEQAPEQAPKALLQRLEQAIAYEDTGLLVLNKPAGLAVHGGSGLNFGAIEALRQLRPQCRSLELVHRLDRDTSGLLMISKKRSLLRHLHQALRGGQMEKRYLALVKGAWPVSVKQVQAPLLKNHLRSGERMVEVSQAGKEALTRFKVVRRYADFASLVEASPVTGRTHQIRVHARHAGHPIGGDEKYGDDTFSQQLREWGGKRLFLHACALRLPLPDGQYLSLEAPTDQLWNITLDQLHDKFPNP